MPLNFTLESFKTHFEGGAKAFLFKWKIPEGTLSGNTLGFVKEDTVLVKATSLPETTVEEHIVEYQQINYKMAGQKTFNDWPVTFIMNAKGRPRIQFENWMNKIQNTDKDNGVFISNYSADYMALDMEFFMLKSGFITTGDELIRVTLINAWPKSIGPVTLDYSSQEFAQFDVTFSYLYHRIVEKEW